MLISCCLNSTLLSFNWHQRTVIKFVSGFILKPQGTQTKPLLISVVPVVSQYEEVLTIANRNVLLAIGKAGNDGLSCQKQTQLPLPYKTLQHQRRETEKMHDSSLKQKLTKRQITGTLPGSILFFYP